MSIETLPQELQTAIKKVVETLKASGASAATIFGSACDTYKSGDDIQIAVTGLNEDQLLRATGRIMMDHKVSVELCDSQNGSSAFAGFSGKKITIL